MVIMTNFLKVFVRDFIIFSAFVLLVFMVVVYFADLNIQEHVGTVFMMIAAVFFGLLIREFMDRGIGGRQRKRRREQVEKMQQETPKPRSSTKVVPKKRKRK